MDKAKQKVKRAVASIEAFDDLERDHLDDVAAWLESDEPIFRISKPDNPPKHLVAYFVLFDEAKRSLMLVDHIKAALWLPTGGHVEAGEDPKQTVIREATEELNVTASFDTPFGDKPCFITVTQTKNAGVHTDVSLWYVIKGDADKRLEFDAGEMNSYKWFGIEQILATDIDGLDPHMHRFTRKLKQRLIPA